MSARQVWVTPPPGLKRLGVRPPLNDYLQSIWARRDFVCALPIGQLRNRNANTALGGLWHLLNPLILAGTYYLIFGIVFGARNDDRNYVTFLVIGLFVFFYTQKSMTGGASTIVANDGIIRNVNLPRAVFPLGSVLAETLTHIPAMGLVLLLAIVTGEDVSVVWLALPLLLLLQAAFNLGLSLFVGRLTFHFRDMQNLLPFIARVWLYMSGVFFAASRVPEGAARQLFEANPAQVFIALHRDLFMEASISGKTLLTAVAWSTVSLVSGFLYFWYREDSYGRD